MIIASQSLIYNQILQKGLHAPFRKICLFENMVQLPKQWSPNVPVELVNPAIDMVWRRCVKLTCPIV